MTAENTVESSGSELKQLANDREYIQYLLAEVNGSYHKYEKRRIRNEKYAVLIRFLALFLSAIVTIILGLNLEPSRVWNGVALILSALTGVVSGFSTFFDFNALAIKFKDTQDKLNMLRIQLEYFDLRDGEVTREELDKMRDDYLQILRDTYEFFQSVKKEDSDDSQGKAFQEDRQG
ncbi:MAG: DUF4231 domain-containing protein [Mariprofundales bacterium]